MVANINGKAAIVGVGNTEFSKDSGVSELNLAVTAIKNALDDASLKPTDIDGFATFTMDNNDEVEVARALGCGDINFWGRAHYGGGAATGSLQQAVMAVATGMAECVAVFRALNGRSGHRYSEGVSGQILTADAIHWGWYMPYGLLTPASWTAMITKRWMHRTGVTKDALFEVAKTTRDYAVNNPNAFFHGKPLTREDYDNARMIADPLQLFDCCQESDGASAVIVTTPERARDLKQPAVVVKGVAAAFGADQEQMTSFYREEFSNVEEHRIAARKCYEMSDLTADDVDAAVFYDAFTPNVLLQMEAWQFCEFGGAGDFVLGGAMRPDGRLPTNTHGGQLSEAYIHGVNGIVEATRLARGQSVNQPNKDVNHVLVTSGVGVPTGGAILGKLD
ncbi:lipid-transfer protein [Halioglobus sp. HI00S01]|uniref:thiolase C-terminal domain-containing protein n=1 Tax=Halioglobus sp. HI00S01 TaxID=1822214 RepID=UPI0007C3AC4F|nr:lipid-transfer protein [Halioglobus sp. HI00S01]KZX58941.1 lipid-transfer protein [Halioglobus sp. HI00S01]